MDMGLLYDPQMELKRCTFSSLLRVCNWSYDSDNVGFMHIKIYPVISRWQPLVMN